MSKKYEILNIVYPKRFDEWGTFQLDVFPKTFFRFSIEDKEIVLERSTFTLHEIDGSEGNQHQMSDVMHETIQKSLKEHAEQYQGE